MADRTARIRYVRGFLFCLYLLALFYFLLFAEIMGRNDSLRSFSYNLVPFQEIGRFWKYRSQLGAKAVLLNLGGNVLGFVPFGILVPTFGKRYRSFLFVLLSTFSFSLCVEMLQLFLKSGSFDVDDILLNTAGGIIGYGIYCLTEHLKAWSYRNGLN